MNVWLGLEAAADNEDITARSLSATLDPNQLAFYLDDGIHIARHNVLGKALVFLNSEAYVNTDRTFVSTKLHCGGQRSQALVPYPHTPQTNTSKSGTQGSSC